MKVTSLIRVPHFELTEMIVLMQGSTPGKGKTVPLLREYFFYKDRLTALILELKPNVGSFMTHLKRRPLTTLSSRAKETKWIGIRLLQLRVLLPREMGLLWSTQEWKISPLSFPTDRSPFCTSRPRLLYKNPHPHICASINSSALYHALYLLCVTYPDIASQQYIQLSCQ